MEESVEDQQQHLHILNGPQQQVQQQRRLLCAAPKPEVWDDYTDSVMKNLIDAVSYKVGNTKHTQYYRERYLNQQAIKYLERTLEKCRVFNPISDKVRPGRKSYAEHAIHFYEHLLDKLKQKGLENDKLVTSSKRLGNDETGCIDNQKSGEDKIQLVISSDANDPSRYDEDHLRQKPTIRYQGRQDVCDVCCIARIDDQDENSKNFLLKCYECHVVFHVECFRPMITEIPTKSERMNWKCSYCILQDEPKKSQSRRYGAKGVRLMARLRNRYERMKKKGKGSNPSSVNIIDDGKVDDDDDDDDEHADDESESGDVTDNTYSRDISEKGSIAEDFDGITEHRFTSVGAESMEKTAELDKSAVHESNSRQIVDTPVETYVDHDDGLPNTTDKASLNVQDQSKLIDDTQSMAMDVESTVLSNDRMNVVGEGNGTTTKETTINVSKGDKMKNLQLIPDNDTWEGHNISVTTDFSTNQRINRSGIKKDDDEKSAMLTRKRSVEITKIEQPSVSSPKSSKRIKKKPALYDPQLCPASSWKSDVVFHWVTESANTNVESRASIESSSSTKTDLPVTPKVNHEHGMTRSRQNSLIVDTNERKAARNNKNKVWCSFCQDDPDILLCCFCACRVCFGKHSQTMILLCDMCDDEYHTFCLQPPLSSVPQTQKWFCPTCTKLAASPATCTVATRGIGRPCGTISMATAKYETNPIPTPSRVATRKGVYIPPKGLEMDDSKLVKSKSSQPKVKSNHANSESINQIKSCDLPDQPQLQLRKRGRPFKNPRPPVPYDSLSSATITSPKEMTEPLSKSPSDSNMCFNLMTKETSSTNIPVLVSRSGRMVKRTNFHDEIDEGEQHLRSMRKYSEESIPSKGNPILSSSAFDNIERTTLKTRAPIGSRFFPDSHPTKKRKESSSLESPSVVSGSDKIIEQSGSYSVIHNDSLKEEFLSTQCDLLMKTDATSLSFPDEYKNYAKATGIAMKVNAVDSIIPSNCEILEDDDVDSEEPKEHTLYDATQNLFQSDDRKLSGLSRTVLIPNDLAETNTAVPTEMLSVSSATNIIQAEKNDDKATKDSSRGPRRKPGARECMQMSRRFGVNEIPQKYMDILMDYCARGKVEHLIRMRERLDEHSRFLESQLAGLEALVKKNGESGIVVPIASQLPGYVAMKEDESVD